MQTDYLFTLEPENTNSPETLFKIGLPLPKGKLYLQQTPKVKRGDGKVVNATIKPVSFWPDNSLKWVWVQGTTPSTGCVDTQFFVEPAPAVLSQECLTQVKRSNDEIRLTHCEMTFSVASDTGCHGFFEHNSLGLFTFNWRFDSLPELNVDSIKLLRWNHTISQMTQNSRDADYVEINLHYQIASSAVQIKPLLWQVTYHIWPKTGIVEVTSVIQNPTQAQHPNGQWDLGDPGSVYIHAMEFELKKDNSQSRLFESPEDSALTFEQHAEIWQQASGGANWDSPVHVTRDNSIAAQHPGAVVTIDDTIVRHHKRYTPHAALICQSGQAMLRPEQFWQHFPSSIKATDGQIVFSLFKAVKNEVELQPGEQKTHRFTLAFIPAEQTAPLGTGSSVTLNPKWVVACDVIPWLSEAAHSDPLQAIINQGIAGESSFYQKREAIDEFGWRHFGDLYADHETAEHKGEGLFPSHYNNQYDPLFGFIKQWLLTGDSLWAELAHDLAKHIVDIDIYHTEDDKPEYNQGLFWHTDHYLPAETASHRTYSNKHASNAYQDHAGGGGPGGQHCYSMGLTYYYLLFGSQAAKQAVFGLTNWITCVYEGDNTLFSFLLSVKNRHRKDLKNVMTGQYPLDRGTANYMMTLLDTYEITGNAEFLNKTAIIIQNTVSPDDNIADRELSNIEENWFYTVFFQAVSRYIWIQEQVDKGNNYTYALASLLHYANWMSENEYPYLEKPEILEYPNQTWTAQDLRKVHILYFAATYLPAEKAQALLNKADELKQYIIEQLSADPFSSYTRILALLMQNYGVDSALTDKRHTKVLPSLVPVANKQGIRQAISSTLKHFSVTREWKHLQKRIPALRRTLS